MKTQLLQYLTSRINVLIGLCFLSFGVMAQPLQSGFYYKLKNSLTIRYGDGSPNGYVVKRIFEHHLKSNIIQVGNRLTFDIWTINPTSDSLRGSSVYINSADVLNSNFFFYMDIASRTSVGDDVIYYSIPYATWEVGLVTVPYKYFRGNKDKAIPNETVKDFNAGIYVGRKWGFTRFYADPAKKHNGFSFIASVFAAPTVIALTSGNTRNQITSGSNELGLSSGVGIMGSYRDVNLALLSGIDMPTSSVGKLWNYHERFWIGLGLGYKLSVFSLK